jgi:nicotinamidase-related amidase
MTRLRTRYYQQFDTDPTQPVPGESYGGWLQADIDLNLQHSALVVMHAWDPGTPQTHAAWWRTVEYLPRAAEILNKVFPPLLETVRGAGMKVFHVVGGPHDYYSHLPGFVNTSTNTKGQKGIQKKIEARTPSNSEMPSQAPVHHPELERLKQWKSRHVFVGEHNQMEVDAALAELDFAPEALPHPGEGIALNAQGLDLLCRQNEIYHLIYIGFAINWCLLMSPGGMVDMSRLGYLCSTIPEAVTAVENKETARQQAEKEQALWRVSLEFGFVFDLNEILGALSTREPH